MKILTCNCMLRNGLKNFLLKSEAKTYNKFNDALIVEVSSIEEIPILFSFLKVFESHEKYNSLNLIIATGHKEVISLKPFKGSVIHLDLGVDELFIRLSSRKFTAVKLSNIYSLFYDCPSISLLTPKEEELLYCILLGFSLNETARSMNIKTKTVYGHLNHLKGKLRQPSVAKMTVFIKRYHKWLKKSFSACKNDPIALEDTYQSFIIND